MNRHFFSFVLLMSSVSLVAQDSTSSRFDVVGYVDTYYAYDWNRPVGGLRQYSNMVARHNEFNINHMFAMGTYEGDRLRGQIGFQTGTFADVNYSAEPSDLYKLIYNANVGVRVFRNIWVDAGVFPGHFGYGSIESIENEVYSKAISQEYTPYYQSGVRVSAAYDKFSWAFVVVNGWQNIGETNKTKALGIDVGYSPIDGLELNYGNYFGNEGDKDIGDKYRFHHSAYVRYTFGPKLHAAVTADFGTQEDWVTTDDRNYSMITILGQYRFVPLFSVGGRLELINDEYQILVGTGIPEGMTGEIYTLNLNYHITGNAMARIEGKFYDMSHFIFNAGEEASSDNTLIAVSIAARFD